MTPDEEADAWRKVRVLALNVIGFYELAEDADAIKTEVQRLDYQAQVYAGGVALARLLAQLAAEADR